MFQTKNQTESFYHAILILNKVISTGTISGDKKLRVLLEKHKTFENIFMNQGELFPNDLLNNDLAKKVRQSTEDSQDFQIITVNDALFPKHLKDIPYASPVLYARGNLDLLNGKTIAVVGTRKISHQEIIKDGNSALERLLNKDYTIVSGLAKGCDALAHEYALNHGGKTIAVLGTPFDKHYPKENRRLQEKIAIEQLLITQYPIGIRSFPSYFAHRNITTAGLSKEGVVVIEASDTSGTQYAIKECIKSKKQLYVLENNLEQGFEWVNTLKESYKVVKR